MCLLTLGKKSELTQPLSIAARRLASRDHNADAECVYRGTSLIRTPLTVGFYSSPMPRDLW